MLSSMRALPVMIVMPFRGINHVGTNGFLFTIISKQNHFSTKPSAPGENHVARADTTKHLSSQPTNNGESALSTRKEHLECIDSQYFSTLPAGASQDRNWVGPPHQISNLRLIKFYVPPDELPSETEFRVKREKLQAWNQSYWASHNNLFQKLREDFVKSKLKEIQMNDPDRQTLSAEEMSEFYKKFLDDNHKKHVQYNIDWYKRNIGLLWPAVKATCARFFVETLRKVGKLDEPKKHLSEKRMR